MSSSVPTLLATYQVRQLEFLLRITRAMTSRLELHSLLELILRSAAEMVGCPAGMILLQPQAPPLDSALRLALLEALSDAAEEITRELAPRSVEVRLRGRDPEFTVSSGVEELPEQVAAVPEADEDGGTWRVSLRMPDSLRSAVEASARADGLSVNAWLVRAVAAALGGSRRRANTDKNFSGWVR